MFFANQTVLSKRHRKANKESIQIRVCGFLNMKITLNDVCEKITDGSHNPPSGIEHSKYLMLSSKNIFDDCITLTEPRYLSENDFATENTRTNVAENDLLMTIVGTVGRVAVVPSDFPPICLQRSVAVIKTDKSKVYPRYMMYQLQSMKSFFEAEAHGVAQKGIYLKQLASVPIQCPNLEVQHEVVTTLDKLQSIITHRKQQIEKLDELVKARFVEMFGEPHKNPMGWNIVKISEVIDGKVSNGFFAKRDEYCEDGNVEVLGVVNIVNRMYSNIENLPRTNATDKDIEKYEVKYGDMLFCRSSLVAEGIGKASIVPENSPSKILFECHVIRFPLDLGKCVPEFMQVLSTTDFFRNQVIAQSKTATMTTIGQDGILKTDIILPPIEKQRAFYDFIKQIDKSKVVSAIITALPRCDAASLSLPPQYKRPPAYCAGSGDSSDTPESDP